MIRTILLSMATFVLAGTLANGAAPPEPAPEEGFRVYTISIRCQTRRLVGVYATAAEACEAAAGVRPKTYPGGVEVTTGSEGKTPPTGRPVLYQLYTRSCSKSGWKEDPTLFTDEKKAERTAEETRKAGAAVEVVRDYAPKEVFHVYGLPCRSVNGTKSRLLGSYRTAPEAIDAADRFRSTDGLRCEVATGTRGRESLDGSPAGYRVYVPACKLGWRLELTTSEQKKAVELCAARVKEKRGAVIVSLYAK